MKRWINCSLALLLCLGCMSGVCWSECLPKNSCFSPDLEQPAVEQPGDDPDPEAPPEEPQEPENPPEDGFTDIKGHWAESSILLAQELGFMNGTSASTFSPESTMSRAMFVTVLFRLDALLHEATPGSTASAGFSDVPQDAYYAAAVDWASANGIVNGTGGNRFSPDELCTREQAVVLMRRYVCYLELSASEQQYLGVYRDSTAISRYARRAMSWAVGAGLIAGVSQNDLSPRTGMTRAQFAVLSLRLKQYLEGTLPKPAQNPRPSVSKGTLTLWVNGCRLGATYLRGSILYIELNDFAQKTGAQLSATFSDYEIPTVTLDAFGHSFLFSDCYHDVRADETWYYYTHPPIYDNDHWYVPFDRLNAIFGFRELLDPDWNEAFYTGVVTNSDIPSGYRVPVLMYHAVSDNIWSSIPELFVSPANMEAQIKAILDAGYTPITFEDLSRVNEISKPVLLTFDDGYRDNYTELFPILKKYNVKATIFLIGSSLESSRYLTYDQIREMQASGLVSFQSHTMSHKYLDTLNASQLSYEMSSSRLLIARITGKEPFVLCYPSGRANSLAKQYAAQYYEFGLHMSGSCFVTGKTEPFTIYRYYISRYTSVSTLLSYLKG